MATKIALITGITGQDAAYLAQFLLAKGYRVFGTSHAATQTGAWRLQELGIGDQVERLTMDMACSRSIAAVIQSTRPDEIYNLAAQSVVAKSFEDPIHTAEVNGLAVVRMLEEMRRHLPGARFLQASSANLFGQAQHSPQNEDTPFAVTSPYAAAKLYAHCMVKNYRDCAQLFACSAILFNHESPLRGEEFVTRKITKGLVRAIHGDGPPVCLGELDTARDWSFAGDFAEAMWSMLQLPAAEDFVLASGQTHTVRDFVLATAKELKVELVWEQAAGREIARHQGRIVLEAGSSPRRPGEILTLCGDARKAREKLNWRPKVDFSNLVKLMVEAEMARV